MNNILKVKNQKYADQCRASRTRCNKGTGRAHFNSSVMHLGAFHFHYFKWKDKDDVCAKEKKKKTRYSLVQNLQGPSLSLLHYLFILCVMSDSTIRGGTALRHRGTSQMPQRCHELSVRQVWLWVIVHEWESVFVVRILIRELRPDSVWLLNIHNIPKGTRWHV